MIKKLVRGNGEKLILVENGEPEAVVMSFAEYSRLAMAGAGAANMVNAASAGSVASISTSLAAVSVRISQERGMSHAIEEQFEMPLYDEREENHEPEFYGEHDPVFDDELPKPLAHDMAVRLADIHLEDLPI